MQVHYNMTAQKSTNKFIKFMVFYHFYRCTFFSVVHLMCSATFNAVCMSFILLIPMSMFSGLPLVLWSSYVFDGMFSSSLAERLNGYHNRNGSFKCIEIFHLLARLKWAWSVYLANNIVLHLLSNRPCPMILDKWFSKATHKHSNWLCIQLYELYFRGVVWLHSIGWCLKQWKSTLSKSPTKKTFIRGLKCYFSTHFRATRT